MLGSSLFAKSPPASDGEGGTWQQLIFSSTCRPYIQILVILQGLNFCGYITLKLAKGFQTEKENIFSVLGPFYNTGVWDTTN